MPYFYNKETRKMVFHEDSEEVTLKEVLECGDLQMLEKMFEIKGKDLWMKTKDVNFTEILIKYGHFDMLKWIVNNGYSFGCMKQIELTIEYGSVDLLQWAITNGFYNWGNNISYPKGYFKDNDKEAYSYDKFYYKNRSATTGMIMNYSFKDDKTVHNYGPIEMAVKKKNIGMLKCLLEPPEGFNRPYHSVFVLDMAIEYGDLAVIKYLANRLNANSITDNALFFAVKHRNTDVIDVIENLKHKNPSLYERLSSNQNGDAAYVMAQALGYTDIVKHFDAIW